MTTPTRGDMVSPAYQRGRAVGQSRWYMGALFTWLARAEDTHGAFSLVDIQGRAGAEPPPHTHSREDEAAFVIEGEITFRVGEKIMPEIGRAHV